MNWLFLILIAVGLYLVYTKSKTKDWQKFLGGILLILGIIFFEFSPDPISFSAYAITHNLDLSTINASNISTYLWQFEIWSITLGIVMLLGAMYLLGWNFKKIWKKINPGKYKIALMIAFGTIIAVALLDLWSANSGIFGNLVQYTNGNFGVDGWWNLFFKFVLIIFALPAIAYYFLVNRDKSESLGIFLFSFILYWGAWPDLFYFLFAKLPLPETLPWLVGSPFINFVSTKLLGYATVTNVGVLISCVLSLIVAMFTAHVLKKHF